MADLLPMKIPLPQPRPVMEEVHPVVEIADKLNFPLPDMPELDLTYPLVGLDWILYPWRKFMEYLTADNVYDQADTAYSIFAFLGVMAVVGAIAVLVFEGSKYIFNKLYNYNWKKWLK